MMSVRAIILKDDVNTYDVVAVIPKKTSICMIYLG